MAVRGEVFLQNVGQHHVVVDDYHASHTEVCPVYHQTGYSATLNCFEIDDEPIADVAGERAVVGAVDLGGRDHFDIGKDLHFGAIVEHLLSLRNAADDGAGQRLPPHDEGKAFHLNRFGRGPHQDHRPLRPQALEVGIDIVDRGNRVDDKIELGQLVQKGFSSDRQK